MSTTPARVEGRALADALRHHNMRLENNMGADVFASSAAGNNATEAFSAAIRQARHDHGHAGYTGTIAEKGAFVMITTGPLPKEAARALARQLLDDEDPRVDDKWGPAGCIPVDDGTYLFFGWASS